MKLFSLSTILGQGARHFNQENHRISTIPRGGLNYIINFQIQSAIFHQKSCFAKIKPLMFTLGNTSSPPLLSSLAPLYTHTHTHTQYLSLPRTVFVWFYLFYPNIQIRDYVVRCPNVFQRKDYTKQNFVSYFSKCFKILQIHLI